MAPLPLALPEGRIVYRKGVRIEPCQTAWIALAFAARLRREGIAAHVATPRTHGTWGIYLAQTER